MPAFILIKKCDLVLAIIITYRGIRMNFEQLQLHPNIYKAIKLCGYTKPTPIQAKAIPHILANEDVIASAQTGTGKTAAYILPALNQLSKQKSGRKARMLILAPTRELATQITQVIGKYGKFMHVNIASLVGGMSYRQQMRELAKSVDIIIATPGRLMDYMKNHRLDLSGIEILVLDEADRMLDMGFIDDVKTIVKATPKHRQTLLFSATVDEKLAAITKQLMHKPIRINLSQEKMAPPLIKQELYLADSLQHKNTLLRHFLENTNIYKAIIFSATKVNADRLANQLRDAGLSASALHGDLKQNIRNKTLTQLRRGNIQFLVATDVASRGIDVNDISHIINYDLPRFSEDYVHRIGRTGRAGKTGVAISIAMQSDFRHLQKIEHYIGNKLERLTVEGLEPKKSERVEHNAGRKKPRGIKQKRRYYK